MSTEPFPVGPIKRIADVTLGKMLQPTSVSKEDFEAPYLRAAHVQPDGRMAEVSEQSMWFRVTELARLSLEPGDVVVVEGGAGFGRSAFLSEPLPGWGFQNSIIRLRPRSGLSDGRFLNYALQASLSSGEIAVVCNSSTFAHFTAEKVANHLVPQPPVKVQIAVSDFLDRETAHIDAFVSEQEQLIGLLWERRASEIDRAVTLGLDEGARFRQSGVVWFDQIRADWRAVQIRRLGPSSESGTSVNGYPFAAENGELAVLKTGSASKGYFDVSQNKIVVPEDAMRVTAPLRAGTLLVNRANTPDLVGSAVVVTVAAQNIYLSDKLWQIEFESASVQFIHYWTQTGGYRAQLRAKLVGVSQSMQNLSYAEFLGFFLPLPPVDQQEAIVDHLDRETAEIDAAIADAHEAVALSKERRAALISAAVTGKIGVRGS